MKKYIIDTNALLSSVTKRNDDQLAAMIDVFEQLEAGQAIVLCPQEVISEFIYVMDSVYHEAKSSIKIILTDFLAMPGVSIIYETDFDAVFSLWPEKIDNYGDAVVAACARATKGASIITFDRKFMRKLTACGIPFEDNNLN